MFLRRVAQGFLQVTLAIYFALLGFDPLTIGFITSVGSFVSAFQFTFFGVLSDKYGRKPFLVIGSIMSALRFLIYIFSRDLWVLIIAQVIGALGVGAGAGQPVVSGYIADKIRKGVKRTRIFSLIAITNALALTLGSLLAALPAYFEEKMEMDKVGSYLPLFWMGLILSLASLTLMLFLREDRRKREMTIKNSLDTLATAREIALYSIVRVTDGLAMNLVSSLAPLYFYLRFGVESEALAPVYAASAFIPIPLYLMVPLLVSKFGYVGCLVSVRIASAFSAFSIPFLGEFSLASLALGFYRIFVQISMPMRQAFATEIADISTTGSLIGVSSSIRSLARSLAPMITGYLFQISHLYSPFVISSLLFLLNALQFHIFYLRKNVNVKPSHGSHVIDNKDQTLPRNMQSKSLLKDP